MISLRDYAKKHDVSYEAVRKQVMRYEKDLEGHITTQNRKRYLDQYAEDFIDEKRKQSPIIIYESEVSENVAELELQIQNLQVKLLEAQDKLITLQEERVTMIEYKSKYEGLIESHSMMEKTLGETQEKLRQTDLELAQANLELNDTKDKLDDALQEAQSYHKSFFGFYRKN